MQLQPLGFQIAAPLALVAPAVVNSPKGVLLCSALSSLLTPPAYRSCAMKASFTLLQEVHVLAPSAAALQKLARSVRVIQIPHPDPVDPSLLRY